MSLEENEYARLVLAVRPFKDGETFSLDESAKVILHAEFGDSAQENGIIWDAACRIVESGKDYLIRNNVFEEVEGDRFRYIHAEAERMRLLSVVGLKSPGSTLFDSFIRQMVALLKEDELLHSLFLKMPTNPMPIRLLFRDSNFESLGEEKIREHLTYFGPLITITFEDEREFLVSNSHYYDPVLVYED